MREGGRVVRESVSAVCRSISSLLHLQHVNLCQVFPLRACH